MFTLKGGPGIILVGLGVLLLIIGTVAEKPETSTTSPKDISLTATETPATAVTHDYLAGSWIKSDGGFTLTFYSDGSFQLEDMSDSSVYPGVYTLTESEILLDYDSGERYSYYLNYVDANTFKMGDAVYYRE